MNQQVSSPPSVKRQFSMRILLIGLLILAWLFAVSRMFMPSHHKSGLLAPGATFPPLTVEGWVNAPGPDKMQGAVTVVDVWAYWCGPCRAAMPEMIKTYEKYRGREVRFIGLTSEGADALAETKEAVHDSHLPWPNAYGAGLTIDALGVEYIPSVFVVGRDGRIVWHSDGCAGTLEAAIESALDKS